MKPVDIKSEAFRVAALRSERTRILATLVVVVIILLVIALRGYFATDDAQTQLLVWASVFLAIILAYEAVILVFVHKHVSRNKELPSWAWFFNILVETSFPTIGLLILTNSEFWGPYRALTAPNTLAYFFFITLSVLRLSPLLSFFTGVVSMVGFLVVTAYTYWMYPEQSSVAALPVSIYMTYGAFLMIGGLIAAGVARQVRVHVIAALREAESRREAEQLKREMDIARSIQLGLLPKDLPDVPGFEIAGWSKPADETGGDYFDWLTLPDGRTIISIADVTGHGIGPALIVAACRAYFRAVAMNDQSLEEVVLHVNELLTHDLPPAKFITAVVGILDPKEHAMQMFSAGHGPLLFYRAETDSVEELPVNSLPLGLMDEEKSERVAREVRFMAGDMLVWVTDGFFEWAKADGELYGTDRLKEAVRLRHAASPTDLIAELHRDVLSFVGGTEQIDDLTAVVVKRCL